MLRRMLLTASGSEWARQMIATLPYTRDAVARYVAGDDAVAAVEAARRLQAEGLLVSLDHLGEDTEWPAQAADATGEYVSLLARLATSGLAKGGAAEVSVKPTAVGLGLAERGEKTAMDNIARICAAARNAGALVTVDMEDHTRVEATLRIVSELRRDFPDLGCVIQSQLRRSADDCEALAYPGSRVRLCKGAYNPPEEVAFRSRAEVDRSYARCLRLLMRGRGYPMFATHDPRLMRIIAAQAELTGRGRGDFEYQMLYGVSLGDQRRLAADGGKVRVYLPYGSDWYGYLVRRLAERPANLAPYLRSLVTRR